MNAPGRFPLPDIQPIADARRLANNRVGVEGMLHAIRVGAADSVEQATVAHVDMFVDLPAHVKGTHMSRFIESPAYVRAPSRFPTTARTTSVRTSPSRRGCRRT